MEIESETQKRNGLIIRWWNALKTLTGKSKAQVVDVAKRVKKLGQDDPRRIIHSIKIGLALTIVSLIYYSRPLYDGFGLSGIWAVLTVVVVFEFTVGATISKCLNRGFATLLAGALGVGAQYLSSLTGEKGEPFLLGTFVFLLAAASTFLRFFPRIKARYDYGVLIFILTFSMVAVSGYRADEIIQLAHQRLSTIIIGAASCMIISIFVCPVWAGEDLHKLVALNIEKIANFLEEFSGVYFQFSENGESLEVSKDDKPFLQAYKSVLNTKATEDSLGNFARWEPGHGCFRFRHPWKQYLKTAALTRQCAYQIEALNGYITSNTKAPQEFQTRIQESCTKMSSESSKALKALSAAIKTMIQPSSADLHLENSKNAIQALNIALKASSVEEADLLAIVPAATVASILIEIVLNVEKLSESVHELSRQANFKAPKLKEISEKPPQLLHRGSINPVGLDNSNAHVVLNVHELTTDCPQKDKNSQEAKRLERVEE